MALMATAADAAVPPEQDPFYSYEGSTPLANIVPGTVLKTRTLSYHVAGVPLPMTAVQLLYRSTGETGAPTVNVTSVLSRHCDWDHHGGLISVLLRLAEPRSRSFLCDLRWGHVRRLDPDRGVGVDRAGAAGGRDGRGA